jgi:hypothetical protein
MMIGLLSVDITIRDIHKLIITPGIVRQTKTISRDGFHINLKLKNKKPISHVLIGFFSFN